MGTHRQLLHIVICGGLCCQGFAVAWGVVGKRGSWGWLLSKERKKLSNKKIDDATLEKTVIPVYIII